jgi:hypothetical protein
MYYGTDIRSYIVDSLRFKCIKQLTSDLHLTGGVLRIYAALVSILFFFVCPEFRKQLSYVNSYLFTQFLQDSGLQTGHSLPFFALSLNLSPTIVSPFGATQHMLFWNVANPLCFSRVVTTYTAYFKVQWQYFSGYSSFTENPENNFSLLNSLHLDMYTERMILLKRKF